MIDRFNEMPQVHSVLQYATQTKNIFQYYGCIIFLFLRLSQRYFIYLTLNLKNEKRCINCLVGSGHISCRVC